MNKTKIEWCDYTINPVKGLCPMACPYCYARRMYKRFKWNPEISYLPIDIVAKEIYRIDNRRGEVGENARIFIGSTMELFGGWIDAKYMAELLALVGSWREHTFIFLTKQPQNLARWSPFPDNCWVGVSATKGILADAACAHLSRITAKVRFLSLEPLLEGWGEGNSINNGRLGWQANYHDINWVILGSQTQPTQHPPHEWVDEIISAADKAKIPVFVKEPLASHLNINRKEFPLDHNLREG